MKHGYVWKEKGERWYEPQHLLMGSEYFLHAYGSLYVTSGEVVKNVVLKNYDNLRMFSNEGESASQSITDTCVICKLSNNPNLQWSCLCQLFIWYCSIWHDLAKMGFCTATCV